MDCFERAIARRAAANRYMAEGQFSEAVETARSVVDLVMLGTMAKQRQPITPHEVASGRPASATSFLSAFRSAHNRSHSNLLTKERLLSTAPVGTVLPTKLFSEADAITAMEFADDILDRMVFQHHPSLRPSIEMSDDHTGRYTVTGVSP
ncbi:hypothetical protein GE253_22840 [Niveispirillum sp. SYP-B3756]|uniref:hypothetical protein n=1 Tax=Niveispirillum sp. SYP-B3756 TaxID=2662178 RepID=UPI0012914A38|nr:hypothetical protein [Niveispirillum sp. SYP-B3756]MQP68159.1 hypothetical protein [Niveispirillum sp. SYP-B3756]